MSPVFEVELRGSADVLDMRCEEREDSGDSKPFVLSKYDGVIYWHARKASSLEQI